MAFKLHKLIGSSVTFALDCREGEEITGRVKGVGSDFVEVKVQAEPPIEDEEDEEDEEEAEEVAGKKEWMVIPFDSIKWIKGSHQHHCEECDE